MISVPILCRPSASNPDSLVKATDAYNYFIVCEVADTFAAKPMATKSLLNTSASTLTDMALPIICRSCLWEMPTWDAV